MSRPETHAGPAPTAEWRRVKEVFHRALELAGADRAAFLARSCGGDGGLREEVEALLAADGQASSLLDGGLPQAIGAVLGQDAALGRSIGSYRLEGEIGRGGMAIVYRAVRDDEEYQRQVAVKLIKRGLDSEPVIARFRQERQILADLDHPCIARLFEGGLTDDGLPYLIMELVDGEPIDAYCERHALGLRQRLELFRKVCGAVEYAHRNLVVHRDLKPSNILVTAEAEPKLLDFGIAKLLAPDRRSAVGSTLLGQRPMTPEFASPEQVLGRPITTASDVYSLGVLLYRLLTGRAAYRADPRAAHQLERAICEEEPERPSRRVRSQPVDGIGSTERQRSAAARRDRLARALRGDLDQIVLKALRKSAEERYGSVAQLSEDLRRHLTGLPVLAHRDTALYRLRKFVRRHRTGVIAAALVTASLVVGVVVSAWQASVAGRERRRAEEQAQLARGQQRRAERVVDFLVGLFEVADPGEALGATITAHEVLERGARRIEHGLADRPADQAAVMSTVGTVYTKLGLYEPAEPLLERALAIRREHFGEGHPEVGEALAALAELERAQGRFDGAEALHRQALAVRLASLGEDHPSVDESRVAIAQLLLEDGRLDHAEELLQRTLERQRRASAAEGSDLASTLSTLALVLKEKGHYDEAEPLLREALERGGEERPPEHPSMIRMRKSLADLLRARGDYADAQEAYEEVLAVESRVLGEEHPSLATTLNNLAGCLADRGELDRAEALFHRSLELRRDALQPQHPDVAESLNNLARVAFQRGQPKRAESLARQALEILTEPRPGRAVALNNLAAFLERQGRLEEAEALYLEALALNRNLYGERHLKVASNLNNLGALAAKRAEHETALERYRHALSLLLPLLGAEHLETARVRKNLAQSLLVLGRAEEAEAAYRRALGAYEALEVQDLPEVAFARTWLGRSVLEQGRPAAAEPLLREAAEAWRSLGARGRVGLAISRSLLGDCIGRQRRSREPEALLRGGVEELAAALGEAHPETVAARRRLDRYLAQLL